MGFRPRAGSGSLKWRSACLDALAVASYVSYKKYSPFSDPDPFLLPWGEIAAEREVLATPKTAGLPGFSYRKC